MDSAGASSSPFDSFKSKKAFRSSVDKPQLSGEVLETPSHQNPLSAKTPKKPAPPPRSLLTRRRSLRSVSQVREAAKQLTKSDLKPSVSSDLLTSSASATEIPNAKPKMSKSLPEKYEMLYKFFHSLGSSIRLLRLKGSMPTFTNISRQVQSLTDRSFGYRHLAQMKYILPEAIEMKKILVRDDRTSCMKPDLQITLNFSIVQTDENLSSDNASLLLSKMFRSRLLNFCKSNPEEDEVPEEMLPEPFNRTSRSLPKAESVQNATSRAEPYENHPVAASLLPPSFKRRFSKPTSNAETVSNVDISSTKLASLSNVQSPAEQSIKLPETPIKSFNETPIKCFNETPIKSFNGTPIKLTSTPFTATPAQSARPTVRGLMTPDEEPIMSYSKLTRRARSITFDTPLKNKTPPNNEDDLSDILSHDLLASIREKELKALEEKNPEISQAKWRKQMVARLPKLFDTLLFFFQSTKRSIITKQKLVNMLVSNQLEIVDPGEIDEQLRLLQELAPEWIYEKVASSGDLLFCVNNISSPESIRARLSNAN